MKWGIEEAIKNSTKAPDVIFHKGDMGKRTNDNYFCRESRKYN